MGRLGERGNKRHSGAISSGHGFKEKINRWPRKMDKLCVGELEFARSYQQVLARWSDVSCARLHDLSMLRLFYADLHRAAQKVRDPTLVSGREMLDDHDAAGKVARQPAKHVSQRVQPACGSADGHHVLTALAVSLRLRFLPWPHHALSTLYCAHDRD